MRKTHQHLGLLVIGLCLSSSGCLDYREHLTLNKDGSGTLQIDFVVNLKLLGEVSKVLGEEPDPEAMRGPSKEEVLEGLKVKGIEVEEVEVKHKESKSKVHLRLKFEDLDALGRIQGFGDDRRFEFFDNGDGRVLVVYSFDTDDVFPVEELGEEGADEEPDLIEQKIMAITKRARDSLKFRARLSMPGRILKSNGTRDPEKATDSLWSVDKKGDPERHAILGKGRVRMSLLMDRASLPFVKELKPREPRDRKGGPAPPSPPGD